MLISYIHFYYKESIFRRHRFDIVTISSCNCLINCIAVDFVDIDTISSCSSWINCFAIDIVDIIDIDTISFHDCWISCIAVDIVDIDTISSCSCWINCIAVDIVDIDSISTGYRFMIVGSDVLLSISIRYRYYIILWLLDQLYCCRYRRHRRYRYDIALWLLGQLYFGTQHSVNLLYIYVHVNIKIGWDRQQVNHTTVSDKDNSNGSQLCIIV